MLPAYDRPTSCADAADCNARGTSLASAERPPVTQAILGSSTRPAASHENSPRARQQTPNVYTYQVLKSGLGSENLGPERSMNSNSSNSQMPELLFAPTRLAPTRGEVLTMGLPRPRRLPRLLRSTATGAVRQGSGPGQMDARSNPLNQADFMRNPNRYTRIRNVVTHRKYRRDVRLIANKPIVLAESYQITQNRIHGRRPLSLSPCQATRAPVSGIIIHWELCRRAHAR